MISLCVSKFLIVGLSQFSEGFCELLAAEVTSRTVLHLFLPGVIVASRAQELRTGKDIFPCHFSDAEDAVFYSFSLSWLPIEDSGFMQEFLFQLPVSGESKVNLVPVWVLKHKVTCEGLFPCLKSSLNANTLVSVSGNWEFLLICCKLGYEFKDVFCLIHDF